VSALADEFDCLRADGDREEKECQTNGVRRKNVKRMESDEREEERMSDEWSQTNKNKEKS
jgi:hypothetical protein